MSDLIDRQAALDTLTSSVILVTNNNVDAVKKVMELFIDKIRNLPAAEPTQTQRRANADSTQNCALDCISRQAAIDALIWKIRPHNNGDGTITMCVMSEELVRKTLDDLPSAQPEIIRCGDCKYFKVEYAWNCASYPICEVSPQRIITPDDYCSFAERRTDEAD